MLYWHVPPCDCNIARVSLHNVRQLIVRFFFMWYYTRPGVGILSKKNRLIMNYHSFLSHKYSFFNAVVTFLIDLKTLKKFGALPPETLIGLSPGSARVCHYILVSRGNSPLKIVVVGETKYFPPVKNFHSHELPILVNM